MKDIKKYSTETQDETKNLNEAELIDFVKNNTFIPQFLKREILNINKTSSKRTRTQIKDNLKEYAQDIFIFNYANAKAYPVEGEGLKRKPKKELDFMEQV